MQVRVLTLLGMLRETHSTVWDVKVHWSPVCKNVQLAGWNFLCIAMGFMHNTQLGWLQVYGFGLGFGV